MAKNKPLTNHQKELAKKDLLIGILTEHIGFDKTVKVTRKANYAIKALAIDLGKEPTKEQIEKIASTLE